MRKLIYGTGLLAVGAIALLHGCRKETTPVPVDVQATQVSVLAADPQDAAWNNVPEFTAKLLPQDLVEPRQIKPTTPEVRVKAMSNGKQIAFRLEWADATHSDLPGAARFCDAAGVQMPARVEASIPAPQMGEPGKPVEISYWNAAWQAVVDGRGDSISDLYPNARVDHYPFNAASLTAGSDAQKAMEARYSPARSLGNAMGGPRTSAVQDLLAEGPGTLAAAPSTTSTGRGKRTPTGWAVVIIRKLPQGIAADKPSQVALAVWDGGSEEVGARKMRTGWIPLSLGGKP